MDPDIDENSPDEDKRQALQNLQADDEGSQIYNIYTTLISCDRS